MSDAGRDPANRPGGRRPMVDLGEAGRYLSLGLELSVTMIVCAGGGYLVDRWLGTLPWGIVAGAILGMVTIFVQLLKLSRSVGRKPPRRPGDERGGAA